MGCAAFYGVGAQGLVFFLDASGCMWMCGHLETRFYKTGLRKVGSDSMRCLGNGEDEV